MFKKFCVPVVNEPLSVNAAKAAINLAKQLGASVLLTNVYAMPPLHLVQDADEVRLELKTQSTVLLEQCLEYASDQKVDAQILPLEMSNHQLAATIALIAEDNHCDLLVMATHAREGINRLLLGSVSEGVTRHSTLPVLLMRQPPTKPLVYENILLALDGYESSLAALEVAHSLAKQLPARLELLHVVPDVIVYADPMMPSIDTSRQAQGLLEYGKQVLYAAENSLQDVSDKQLVLEEARGKRIGDVILQTAQFGLADLIVLGTHGYTGLERLLLGSVAQQVAHHAHVPVLLVRNVQHAKAAQPMKARTAQAG